MYKTYKLSEIAKKANISRKEAREHIVAKTLIIKEGSESYEIKESDFQTWLNQVPDLNEHYIQNSIFFDQDNEADINNMDSLFVDIKRKWKRNLWSNSKTKKNGLKYADVFAGAGGLSLGFFMAGYKPVGFVEIDESAVDTYTNNIVKRSKHNKDFTATDIRDINNKKTFIDHLKNEEIDVLLGGFPCKGFSNSGVRSATDDRNTLYKDMLEIVIAVKPKYVVMENVVGLLSLQGGRAIKKIVNDYDSAGYRISYEILNSVNYEVPQNRKRVILIANRIGKPNYYPKSILKNDNEYKTVRDAIYKYKDLDDDLTINHIKSKHSVEMKQRLLNVPIGKTLYANFNDSWKKCDWDKPSCTIKENHGATNIHPELPRVITPREMAELQSFPEDFIFKGTKTRQLKQIGNAVPPLLSKAIALAIEKGMLE